MFFFLQSHPRCSSVRSNEYNALYERKKEIYLTIGQLNKRFFIWEQIHMWLIRAIFAILFFSFHLSECLFHAFDNFLNWIFYFGYETHRYHELLILFFFWHTCCLRSNITNHHNFIKISQAKWLMCVCIKTFYR